MNNQKMILSILSFLVSISLSMSAYIFFSMEKRINIVEATVSVRGERIATLEQQAKENTAAHTRLETKLDVVIAAVTIRK